MPPDKPYSAACERNRGPILAALQPHLADRREVLEIGSGTGQHAVYFAGALPHLNWQTSDVPAHLPGISAWLAEAALPNMPPPQAFDVNGVWPTRRYDAVYSANTLHIMSWEEDQLLFRRLPEVLAPGGLLAIYGPFNYGGRYTSDSNRAFDASLRLQANHMGIRDFEAVQQLAAATGLRFLEDIALPANNRLLLWRRA